MEEELKDMTPSLDEEKDITPDTEAEPIAAPVEEFAQEAVQGEETQNENAEPEGCPPKKRGLKAWWERHKPSKRRLIQVYSLLLYNAYMKGFIKGEIFKGMTKSVCVPGLNCYSCPGAVGACPLGALQNALASSGARAPYFMIGILLLYGLIFARTICGFLCPVGLCQDMMYKIRTPKLKKSRGTRILSYLKYVILAVLVIGIPVIYALDQTVVPGFCKYICPAGTFEGAFMLLLHPESNANIYEMLGPLFTWKTAVMVCVFAASIFIYRVFCRFLCPLGAIYGLFNKFALLGVKVDRSKCTDCGKCLTKCKMDIRKVGDHECINCGECIDVCPTNAITWKGGRVFLKNVDTALVPDGPALDIKVANDVMEQPAQSEPAAPIAAVRPEHEKPAGQPKPEKGAAAPAVAKSRHEWKRWVLITFICLAAALYIGIFVYANFFAGAEDENVVHEYKMVVASESESPGVITFRVGDVNEYVMPSSGVGTEDDPYVIGSVQGIYMVTLTDAAPRAYFKFIAQEAGSYKVTASEDLSLKVYYVLSCREYGTYDYQEDGDELNVTLKVPDAYGNTKGFICTDFTLDGYNGVEKVTLWDHYDKGNVIVINFWGTWCGPCVEELPYFEQVRAAYANVEVIAVSSVLGSGTVVEMMQSKGWDKWGVIFCQDTGTNIASDVYKQLGGGSEYPRTFVLEPNGRISTIFEKSVTVESLSAAVETAGAVKI